VLITGGELVASTETMFGVKCRLVCDPPVGVKDPVAATHLYRIAQEAVSNAIKHDKAGEVAIQLQTAGERTSLSVHDNGVGFPKAIPKQEGMGLRIMQSRAGMIGGSLSIEKGPAGGTTVLCAVPAGA
jgi:signal transduction histidine kinase